MTVLRGRRASRSQSTRDRSDTSVTDAASSSNDPLDIHDSLDSDKSKTELANIMKQLRENRQNAYTERLAAQLGVLSVKGGKLPRLPDPYAIHMPKFPVKNKQWRHVLENEAMWGIVDPAFKGKWPYKEGVPAEQGYPVRNFIQEQWERYRAKYRSFDPASDKDWTSLVARSRQRTAAA